MFIRVNINHKENMTVIKEGKTINIPVIVITQKCGQTSRVRVKQCS